MAIIAPIGVLLGSASILFAANGGKSGVAELAKDGEATQEKAFNIYANPERQLYGLRFINNYFIIMSRFKKTTVQA